MMRRTVAGKIVDGQYVAMVENTPEQKRAFAEMLAARTPPQVIDKKRSFMQGRANGEQMSDGEYVSYYRRAKRAGLSVEGKQYISGLARWAGGTDPRAWVDDPADIERICRRENLNAKGIVNVEGEAVEAGPSIGLAKHIVDREVAKRIRKDPSLAKKRKKVEEDVRAQHTPRWKQGQL